MRQFNGAMKEYRAAFKSEIRSVGLARRGIAGFAAECGFSEEAVADIRLAAGEALSNAVEHAGAKRSHKIVVLCTFDMGELAVEIADRGCGFAEPADLAAVAPDHRGRGFGIFLMRRLMDEVTYSRSGTVVRLVRRRH
jgi:serine/threonine-protein kinase RsbW